MPDSPTSETESEFVCDCGDEFQSACAGEPFYKEHEGKRYCVLHFPSKEKSADFKKALLRKLESKDFNFRGVWFPDNVSFSEFDFSEAADFRSATFSGWASFVSAKFSAKVNFTKAKFSAEANFILATFSAASSFSSVMFSAKAKFDSATFSGKPDFSYAKFSAEANFNSATFSGRADFSYAKFSAEANFTKAKFSAEAWFPCAKFSAASFFSATFNAGASFFSAEFSAEANFTEATFSALANFILATFSAAAYFRAATFSATADFRQTAFRDYVKFSGSESNQAFSASSSLDLEFGKIEKPDRVSFHTLTLHPHWFVNIDPRQFDFINVHWNNSGKAKPELKLLKGKEIASPHRLLAIACRKLATNSEENNRYREASHFRRMAFDAERLETWRGFDFRRLNWWYWLASGYGERPFQALIVLVGILFMFGAVYTKVGFARWEPRVATESEAETATRDQVGAPLNFSRALTYSAGVMTLQRPEPKPATAAAQTLVLLETILGPVQAALLALAIRRKFMR